MAARVPRTDAVRLLACCALLLAAVSPRATPPAAGPIAPVLLGGACRLDAPSAGEPCPCEQLPGALRLLLGLPLPLNDAPAADLERLPGIGPQRARAIAEERRRRGRFEAVGELVAVPGLGPASVERLSASLFVGQDPACRLGGKAPARYP